MFPFFLAALLVATPVTVPVPTTPQSPATQDAEDASTTNEAFLNAKACVALGSGEITADQLISGLQLDTPQKIHTFIVTCKTFLIGVKLGHDMATPRTPA